VTQLLSTTHNMRAAQFLEAFISNLNLADGINTSAATCQWTPGSAQIDTIDEQPFLDNPWTLQSWSLRYQLFSSVNGADATQDQASNGIFSGLYGGIMVNNSNLQTPFGSVNLGNGAYTEPGPFVPYLASPMPATGGTIAQLWDGGINDPFPPNLTVASQGIWGSIGNPGLTNTLVVDQQLPQSINMGSGDSLSCGLWLPPSLLGGSEESIFLTTGIFVCNAQFTIAYTAERP